MQRKLNVLINGFHISIGRRVLERGFASVPVGRCIHITSASKTPNIKTEEPIQIHSGKLEDIDWQKIHPLDEEIIEALRPCEGVFMEMMNRIEAKGRVISYEQRRRDYLRIVRYWSDFLDRNKINFFLSVNLPHRIRTFALSELCKYKKIPALYSHHASPIPAVYYLTRDWEQSVMGLKETLQKFAEHPPTEEIILSGPIGKYWRTHVEKEGDPSPWFVHKPPATPVRDAAKRILSLIRHLRSLSKFLHDQSRRKKAATMFRFYDEHAIIPDLTKRFIYLPLQVQPEVTTCPMGGAFVQQSLIAEMLNAVVPDDVLIYVKEHPNQQYNFPDGRCRDISLYKDFLSMKNVRLVPRTFSTFDLMKNAVAVACATGSAGLEALLREKPFLMFGHNYYQYAPGTFTIRSLEDCRSALKAILDDGVKPTIPAMKLFFYALGKNAFPGYLSDDLEKVTVVTEEECIDNLGNLLAKRIHESCFHS